MRKTAFGVVLVLAGLCWESVVSAKEVNPGTAPSPSSTSPNKPVENDETGNVEAFGFLTLVIGVDNHNQGGVVDTVLTPLNDVREEVNVNTYAVPAGIGLRYTPETLSNGWRIDGQLLGAFLIDTNLLLIDSFARVQHPSGDLSFAMGRYTPGILSPYVPSTWNYSFGWGNLQTLFTGLRIEASSTIGLFVDGGIGINEPLANRSAIVDAERGSERTPFFNARFGWKGARSGTRFGRNIETNISVSLGYGRERVGTNEDDALQEVAPGARLPVVEDISTWTVGSELQFPITEALVVTAEAYLGRNSHIHTGAMFQRSRIDLDTGRHFSLHSAGGWLELSLATKVLDLAVIAGGERILGRFDETSLQLRDDIRSTLKAAFILSVPVGSRLSVGFQTDYFATNFDQDSLGTTVNITGLLASRFLFN